MKVKILVATALTGMIPLSMIGGSSIVGSAQTAVNDEAIITDALPYSDTMPMYAEGELICLADTEGEAWQIAEAYGVELKDYGYGYRVAVFDCGDRDLDELIAYGKANDLPPVEKNGIIYMDPREWGGSFRRLAWTDSSCASCNINLCVAP